MAEAGGVGGSERVERLERSLQESEERFRTAFHTLPDAVTLTETISGRFVAVNEGAARVTGWLEAEMVWRTGSELGLWHDQDRDEFLRQLREGGVVREFETHLRRKDGSVIEVALAARPLQTSAGALLLTVTRDLTPQREAERARDAFQAQLRQSQKLEAVGRLAGGVAHDFNNMLTVIFGCAGAIGDQLQATGGEGREELAELLEAADRARDLTRQLLAFARRQVITPVPLDLNALVVRSQKLLRRVLGEDVCLEVATQPGVWTVCCDPAQLEQAVLNLGLNARDALPRGGHLRLETTNRSLDEAGAAAFPGAVPGRYVLLAVEDDGTGMAPELQERAFEPFFTTKAVGKGTGLGLATVHGIVTQSGGFLRLLSEPGRGTRVELLLPAADAVPVALPPEPAPLVKGGHETVLLVEDEEAVRAVLARSLRRAGYRVLEASGGEEALALGRGPEPVAAVVCDVVMPGAGGREVVEGLRALRPGLKALFVSGYPHDAITTRGLLAPGVELLGKPFTSSALLARLRALLDG
jgi:PAS domain S-box-containing protein